MNVTVYLYALNIKINCYIYNNLMCDKCDKCDILKKKLAIYEKCLREIKELDDINDYDIETEHQYEIHLEKNNNGETVKKISSDLSESYLVIDDYKTIDQISSRERTTIKSQDVLSNVEDKKKYIKKASKVYGIGNFMYGVGKMIFFL